MTENNEDKAAKPRMTQGVRRLSEHMNIDAMEVDADQLVELVKYEVRESEHAAYITFDNPERHNALPVASFERIVELIKDAEADDRVKTIVLEGKGKHFGTGGDARELGHFIGYRNGEDHKRPSQAHRILPDSHLIFGGLERAIAECLKVVLCSIRGYCYGAHVQMALASDIVVATPTATFTHPALRYIGPAGQNLHGWVSSLGIKKAKDILFTMRAMSATEALQAGFLSRIVADEELESVVSTYTESISMMPLDAVMVGKMMFNSYQAAQGQDLGGKNAIIGHSWVTNQVLREDEWNFLKARREDGLREALARRDQAVDPWFRLTRD